MHNNCTLIIDGNWLMMSRYYTVADKFHMDNPPEIKEQGVKILQDLMSKSISIALNKLNGIVDNVILVSDGGSWRKSLEKPLEREGVDYKGNRKRNSDTDWSYIYKSLDSLKQRMNFLGITTTQADECEGDDWCWYWSKKLASDNINSIIWSFDHDLMQLVSDKTMWWNDKDGIFMKCEKKIDVIEFFLIQEKVSIFENVIKSRIKKQTEIDPEDIVMEKVICGDSGDNILSIASYTKGKKTYKVTPKLWSDIKIYLNIQTLQQFIDTQEKIFEYINNIDKFSGNSIDSMEKLFAYNLKLVFLDESTIINKIKERMENNSEYKIFDVNEIRRNYRILCPEKEEYIFDLFEGI